MPDRLQGFVIVILGLVCLLTVFLVANFKFTSASDVTTTVTSVGGVIGTIVGAFFGLQLGAAGKDKVEQQRNKAQERALELAGMMSRADFESLKSSRSDLFRDLSLCSVQGISLAVSSRTDGRCGNVSGRPPPTCGPSRRY
jgi:hypothetical protein